VAAARLSPGWPKGNSIFIFTALTLTALLGSLTASAQTAAVVPEGAGGAVGLSAPAGDIMDLPLEALMSLQITSVSKKEQCLNDAATAIYILTSEDLRRSGATSIPEALRVVPGLHVARIDANKWAISARGFNDRFANKMQVVVDGRSVYTQLSSGVFWETLDIPFALIDRIEVIRGTGASIWGANAVNGVINIITKSAKEANGTHLEAGLGTDERGWAQGIHHWDLGRGAHLRVHGLWADRTKGRSEGELRVDDSWQTGHGGVRFDWTRGPAEQVTFVADVHRLRLGTDAYIPSLTPPYRTRARGQDPFDGQSAMVRWSRAYAGRGELTVQSYVHHYRFDFRNLSDHQASTFDLELANRLTVASDHETMVGAEFRSVRDETDSSMVVSLDPARSRTDLASGFVQHEARFLDARAVATLGARFEHYGVSHWEVQPNARLLCHLTERQTVWAAVSRAVRTPSRADRSIRYIAAVVPPDPSAPGAPAVVVRVEGNPAIDAEKVRAFDAGYRSQISSRFLGEITVFDYDYRDLRSGTYGDPGVTVINGSTFLVVPSSVGNDAKGHTSGFEVLADWRPSRRWRLTGALSHLVQKEELTTAGSTGAFAPVKDTAPAYIWTLRSLWTPARKVELDCQLRQVSAIVGYDIPSYLVTDVRVGYEIRRGIRGAVIGRNLLSGPHREFVPGYVSSIPTEVTPGLGLQVEWNP
jgi:iron complex outermembrane receptor protein